MQRPSNTKFNEQGFASIVIALILIIVLALLTIGFAQLARREQQTALDKQLATQANYAAESGYNNAYKDILSGAINVNNASSTNCMKAGPGSSNLAASGPLKALTANQNINSSNGVSYSCLLVQLQTPDLPVGPKSPGTDTHFNFSTSASLTNLTILWGSGTNRYDYAPSLNPATDIPTLSTLGNWKYPPVMEVNITPISNLALPANQSDPNGYLIKNTFTFYAYPSSNGSNTITYDPSKQGQVVSGACNVPAAGVSDPDDRSSKYPCAVELSGLNGQQFVMHETPFYDTSYFNACATGSCGSPNPPITFSGEPMIDVTGKAQNVLKRLRVRFFVNNGVGGQPDDNAILPNGAVEAQNVCKRIQAAPSTTDFPQGSTYDPPPGALGCDLSN